MSTLFDLTGEALQLQRLIDHTAADLFSDDPDTAAAAALELEALLQIEAGNRQALLSKADAWCWVIQTLTATAAARREHSRRLADLAAESDARADALQSRLVAALQRVDPDATSWDLPSHKLASRRTTAVELEAGTEAADLPEAFQRIKTSISADRQAIAAALKAGQSVPGAQLVERRSWRLA
jgi:hypothetical protein